MTEKFTKIEKEIYAVIKRADISTYEAVGLLENMKLAIAIVQNKSKGDKNEN